ncbi:hypothetical protein Tco_1536700, partial [Tanacetum coccineum]
MEDKLVLVDDDGKPLEKVDYPINSDSDDEVKPVENEIARFFCIKGSWICIYNHDDEGFDFYPPLNDDEVGDKVIVDKVTENRDVDNVVDMVGHNMEVDSVEDKNDVAKGVNIDNKVLARQNKIDKESDSDESDKYFDYLSNGEDEVIELRQRKTKYKHSTDKVHDNKGPAKGDQETHNEVEKDA